MNSLQLLGLTVGTVGILLNASGYIIYRGKGFLIGLALGVIGTGMTLLSIFSST
jgi:hypothetical protein